MATRIRLFFAIHILTKNETFDGPGVAMYRTEFVAPANGTAVRLQFQACSFYVSRSLPRSSARPSTRPLDFSLPK